MSVYALDKAPTDHFDEVLYGAAASKKDLKKEDIKNTKEFLEAYLLMLRIVKDFEAAAESGSLTIEDLNVSDAYQFYKSITDFTLSIINNLSNPYERLIMQKLYIEGIPYKNAAMYMGAGYNRELNPISKTTFAERRNKALASIALSLNIIGVLQEMSGEITKLHRGDLKYNIPPRKKSVKV